MTATEWSDVQGSSGTLFGPWHAVESLSRGAASEVYLARHRDDGSLAAVKTFLAAADGADERIRRSREIRLLAGVDHPRVVRILDSRSGARWPERDYIVTEYVDGADLAALLRKAPLSFESTRLVGAAVAEALSYLHRLGIIHRDVKPANIFVPSQRESAPDFAAAKLGDLGIAIEVDATRVTSNGLAVGTANYLSPEQVSGDAITPASDIYSLGLVLLECLSGQRAYGGAGVEAALARLHRPPDIPAAIPRPVRKLLREMLATAPEQRPTADQVGRRLAALERAALLCAPMDAPTARYRRAAGGSRRPGAPRPGAWLGRAARPLSARLAAAVVGAAAVIGTTGFLWMGWAESPAGAPSRHDTAVTVTDQSGQPTAPAGQGALTAPVVDASAIPAAGADTAAAPAPGSDPTVAVAQEPVADAPSAEPAPADDPAASADGAAETASADQGPANQGPADQGPANGGAAPGSGKTPPGQLKKLK